MPKLTIDGIEVEVEAGSSVLQACEQLGIEIPRFCYHDRLSVAGNCRMCLVDVERAPKPVASCCQAVADGMVVRTDTPEIRKARQGVMEFLLINHPLDCPICDQGGECDLQDQAMAYGKDTSRYDENKRAVKDKDLGPIIKTTMTRCIHCTRCVRFIDEVAGTQELGAVNRGEKTEIGTYVAKALSSELSGNLADVCPVGALTSKPYAFKARPWEMRKVETIDVMDALGSNIRVDARGGEVLRVLPRLNEEINEEWISDKTRYCYDGLMRQRLDRPYVRREGKLVQTTWEDALTVVATKLSETSADQIAALAGDLVDVETSYALNKLMERLGVKHKDCRQDGALFDVTQRSGYVFNSSLEAVEDADFILLVGTNPRKEAALLNARIRKAWLHNKAKVAVIGEQADLTYSYDYLGAGVATLQDLLDGSLEICSQLKAAERPLVIVGAGQFKGDDALALHHLFYQIVEKYEMNKEGWNGFNMLHQAAGRVGALDVGFVPSSDGYATNDILKACQAGDISVVYNLGADEIDPKSFGDSFVIYQGHHGDKGAHRADVILPGAAYTEKDALYVNTEGRVQSARRVVYPVGEAKEDWKIVRALSERVHQTLPFKTLSELRNILREECDLFAQIDVVPELDWAHFGQEGSVKERSFTGLVDNFYMTDPISRASVTMAKCTEEFVKNQQEKTGTHG